MNITGIEQVINDRHTMFMKELTNVVCRELVVHKIILIVSNSSTYTLKFIFKCGYTFSIVLERLYFDKLITSIECANFIIDEVKHNFLLEKNLIYR